MKVITKIAAATAVAALTAGPVALAATMGPWSGASAGAQLNFNSTKSDHISSETALGLGINGGYDMQFSEHFELGGDIFYNYNQSKTHHGVNGATGSGDLGTSVYGLDVRAGFPVGQDGAWLPYVKLGYGWVKLHGGNTGNLSTESAMRYGAGVAWMLQPNLSLQAQYMHMDLGSSNDNFKNDTISVGATWHFAMH